VTKQKASRNRGRFDLMDLGDILKPHFEGKAVSPRMTGRVSADGQRKTERLLMHAASPRNPSWSS